MVGYGGMGRDSTTYVLKQSNLVNMEHCSWIDRKDDSEHIIRNSVAYDVNSEQYIIVVPTPISVGEFDRFMALLAKKLEEQEQDLSNYDILLGLEGAGVTEQHIVTVWVPADKRNKDIQVYDPKVSNPEKFFRGKAGVQMGSLLKGLMRSLFLPKAQKTLILQKDAKIVDYISLGTQSFFDGVSCGYHNAINIKTCYELLVSGKEPSRADLLAKTGNPVKEVATILAESPYVLHQDLVHSDFKDFLDKAWDDTFRPGIKAGQKRPGKWHYMTQGSFLTTVIQLIKVPTEWVPNTLSETANYLKNRLIAWAPTHPASQYGRSALMLLTYGFQGLFKGVNLLLRTVTSPITSYKAAKEKHMALGILSACLSGALGVFVAPILAGALWVDVSEKDEKVPPSVSSALGELGGVVQDASDGDSDEDSDEDFSFIDPLPKQEDDEITPSFPNKPYPTDGFSNKP